MHLHRRKYFVLTLALCIFPFTSTILSFNLVCYKCEGESTHDMCNKEGLGICSNQYTGCLTELRLDHFNSLMISKRCGKASECQGMQPKCDQDGSKCSLCCQNDLCNSGHWSSKRDFNPCENNPCKNRGICRPNLSSATCYCRPGFYGDLCENEVNYCSREPCVNGGSCVPQADGFICLCPQGYTGDTCNTKLSCFTCPDGNTGLYKDPYNCTKFYKCQDGAADHHECPQDFVFDPAEGTCDWFWNVQCEPTPFRKISKNLVGCAISQLQPMKDLVPRTDNGKYSDTDVSLKHAPAIDLKDPNQNDEMDMWKHGLAEFIAAESPIDPKTVKRQGTPMLDPIVQDTKAVTEAKVKALDNFSLKIKQLLSLLKHNR